MLWCWQSPQCGKHTLCCRAGNLAEVCPLNGDGPAWEWAHFCLDAPWRKKRPLELCSLGLKDGFRVSKIKGCDTVEKIEALKGSHARLRLDYNRSLTLEHFLTLWPHLKTLNLEYIEEPLQNPDELDALPKDVPLALDETLREKTFSHLKNPRVRALVLKPACLGPTLCQELVATQIPCVVSSSMEGDIGLWHLLWAAALWQGEGLACGLDTYSSLPFHIVEEKLPLTHKEIGIWSSQLTLKTAYRPSEIF